MSHIKICNISQLNDFVAAVNDCQGGVWLESPEGDRFNLKSTFSQYIAFGKLLSEQGDYLELFCSNTKDEQNFYQFFRNHPETRLEEREA